MITVWISLLCLTCIGLLVACGLAFTWFDHVAVRIIRVFGLPVYPTAVMVAMSIVQHPEEWEFGMYEIRHRIIGNIWTGNGAQGLRVDTGAGRWTPGFIERRIIREAVDWRLHTYIRSNLQKAMIQHTRSGKITDAT